MSPARQTIIRVRGDFTDLAAAVAGVVDAGDLAEARKRVKASLALRRSSTIKTTFCPLCGGNKSKNAVRCASCRDAAQRRGVAEAKVAGHGSLGRLAASRNLVKGDAIRQGIPTVPDPHPLTWSHRSRGEGTTHRQAWSRKVLVEGVWVDENSLPDAVERRETDNAAIARLGRKP